MSAFSLLIVDDERNIREGLARYLKGKGYEIYLAENADQAEDILAKDMPDIVLTDLRLGGTKDGFYVLEKAKKLNPAVSVLIFTAYGTVENAVQAMKKGAYDYLVKPINPEELETVLQRVVETRRLQNENLELKQQLQIVQGSNQIVYRSAAMQQLVRMVKQVAPSNASVLIEGESGTGKEVVAHMLHDLSPRAKQPFVPVHCASLTETLLASELFGHEKGAFTGANEKKVGRFEKASGGTLFLDEIAEIKEEYQVKLLRVLQENEIERVGGSKPIKVDTRLICATNKNLQEQVGLGRFREDLYYRINVIRLYIPPLRERVEDIESLAVLFLEHFSRINNKKITGLHRDTLEALQKYSWPGNVRELKNVLERMIVLAAKDVLTVDDLPLDLLNPRLPGKKDKVNSASLSATKISDMEKQMIHNKLEELRGNKSKAAQELGISRRTLYRKLEEYGLT